MARYDHWNLKDSFFLSEGEIKALYSCLKTARDKLLFLVLIRTGRRISEVIGQNRHDYNQSSKIETIENSNEIDKRNVYGGLKPCNIKYDEKLVLWDILKKKEVKKKLIPIDKDTLNQLKQYIKRNRIGYNDRIFPISRSRYFQIIKEAGKEAGIKKRISPHITRHTSCMLDISVCEKYEDIKKVQEKFDHSSGDITDRYLHFTGERMRDIIDKSAKKVEFDDKE